MDLNEIKGVIELMTRNGLSEFDLEKEGFHIRIKRGSEAPAAVNFAVSQPVPASAGPAAASAAAGAEQAVREIVSPMVGTFYRSPSPDSPAYAEVGQAVTEDTVVCIIEAMKVMNEIKAEMRGTITEVLMENGKPVEFGRPLFRVK